MGAFVRGDDPDVLETRTRDRLRYWLIAQDRHEQLLELLEFERDPYALRRTIVRDGATYADLPFLDKPGYPDDLYVWGKRSRSPPRWSASNGPLRGLSVAGYAYLQNIDSGDAQQRKLRIRVVGGDEPFGCRSKWHNREDLTARELASGVTYDNVGLSLHRALRTCR